MTQPRRKARVGEEEAAREVVRRLRDAGHVALFAGGCVRDKLLGRRASDFDVATSAEPEAVRGIFRRTLRVGEQFGIVIVLYGGRQVEVATLRADGDYSDGRRPDAVHYTTDPREDAQRRDFTVNGLFYDPLSEETYDHVGGLDDLRLGRIRAIGDPAERFDEDKLRILRAPRFAAVLGFRLEARTAEEARRRAPEIVTAQVSAERIRTELEKILAAPRRAAGVALCRELGILDVVLPAVAPHADVACRALAALPADAPRPVAWACLVHPLAPERVDAVLRQLRLSNKDREAAVRLLAGLEPARRLAERSVADQKRYVIENTVEDQLTVLRAVALASDGELEPCRYLAARAASFRAERGPAALGAAPLVSGRDLMSAGLRPGRVFGRVLAAVEDAQLEGKVTDREQALALALALANGDVGR